MTENRRLLFGCQNRRFVANSDNFTYQLPMMTWWLWIVFGLALMVFELLTPGGFVILFFGLAAGIVGGFTAVDWLTSGWSQWLVFVILSVVFVLLFRKPFLQKFAPNNSATDSIDNLVGERAKATQEMAPDGFGTVELRGTTWRAKNIDTQAITAGSFCRVENVNGLEVAVKLWH